MKNEEEPKKEPTPPPPKEPPQPDPRPAKPEKDPHFGTGSYDPKPEKEKTPSEAF